MSALRMTFLVAITVAAWAVIPHGYLSRRAAS